MERPEFIPFFKHVIDHDGCTNLDAIVYGYVYWLTRLKNEKCTASNETLANLAKTTPATVQQCLNNLEKSGFIRRLYEDDDARKGRKEILPLLVMAHRGISPSSQGVLAPANQNKSIKGEHINSASRGLNGISIVPVEEKKTRASRADSHILGVFKVWSEKYPKNWEVNTTQRGAAQRLLDERGLEQIQRAVAFYRENKDTPFCPVVDTPYKLDSKWNDLGEFKKRNNL